MKKKKTKDFVVTVSMWKLIVWTTFTLSTGCDLNSNVQDREIYFGNF